MEDIFELVRTTEVVSNEMVIAWTKLFNEDIGVSSILVLSALQEQGAQKATDLALAYGYTKGAITNISTKLVNEGYVVREYDEMDRRIIRLAITEKGEWLLSKAREAGIELRQRLFSGLTKEEQQQYTAIQLKMLKQLKG